MSKKLDELKKQAAKIAEEIKQLEDESPVHKLGRIVNEQIGAASMCWEHVECAGIFDSNRASVCADEILDAVNEYVVELSILSDKRAERIAELEAALVKRDEDLIGVSAELAELEKKHVSLWADIISDQPVVLQKPGQEDESVDIRATFTTKKEPMPKESAFLVTNNAPASAFTTKTEPMLLRPAYEFIIELPEPYRKAALNAIDRRPLNPDKPVENISEALSSSFHWRSDFLKWAELGAAIMSGKKWPDPSLFK